MFTITCFKSHSPNFLLLRVFQRDKIICVRQMYACKVFLIGLPVWTRFRLKFEQMIVKLSLRRHVLYRSLYLNSIETFLSTFWF